MKLFASLRDSTLQRARKILERHFGRLAGDYVIDELGGGASTRAYFRVYLPRVPVNATGILMLTEKRFRLESSDFYQVSEVLRKLNLPAPVIYEDFCREGALYLQDLGDTHLCDLVRDLGDDAAAIEELYRQAIDHVITMQTRASHHGEGVRAFSRSFDVEKLMWEMRFMVTHFAESLAGWRPEGASREALETFFKELTAQIAALPRVFCHRDYHSRNLMYWNERLHIIDFQDARLGPHLYDIVSLLGDSYVDIGADLRARLLEYYVRNHPDLGDTDLRAAQEQYSLVALQRHLKHLGTFGYLHEKGDSSCLPFVPRTIEYLETNLQKFDETLAAASALAELFERVRERLAGMDL